MRFSGDVDWWPRSLEHEVTRAVLTNDLLSLDLLESKDVKWNGKMRHTGVNRYAGSFQTRDGATAEAWGYLSGTGNERLFMGEWRQDGTDHVFVMELRANGSN